MEINYEAKLSDLFQGNLSLLRCLALLSNKETTAPSYFHKYFSLKFSTDVYGKINVRKIRTENGIIYHNSTHQ